MNVHFLKACVAFCVLTIAASAGGASASAALAAPRAIMPAFVPIESMRPPASTRKLYVVDYTHNAIDLFPAGVANPKQIGTITAGINAPIDAYVDSAGTLYVANVANTNPATITEYAAGTSVPKLTIALPDLHPLYVTAGPDGTVYVMVHNKYQRWKVVEFDLGASKPSRTIEIPYEFPYPLVGGGIAVSPDNYLYVNSGSYSGQGDFGVSSYPPKRIKPTGGFTSGGYAGGAVQVFFGECFVGDPGDNNVEIWQLPAKPKYKVRYFATESSGDFLTVDVVSHLLYSVSYGSQTLQIYNLNNGHLLNFLSGFGRGVAIDPAGKLL